MGSIATPPRTTVEEFLSNPAYERCEWIDGRIVELSAGTGPHANCQSNCVISVGVYLRANPGRGRVLTELRCRVKINGRECYYQPDVAIVLEGRSWDGRFLDGAPDIVVEIRSPENTVSFVTCKMNDHFANGAKIGRIILPEERSVVVLTPDSPLRTLIGGEVLDGETCFPI